MRKKLSSISIGRGWISYVRLLAEMTFILALWMLIRKTRQSHIAGPQAAAADDI